MSLMKKSIEGAAVVVLDHQADRARDRLQLQRDVGDVADGGDERGDRRDGEALAVARGQEVGAGGDVFGLRQPHDPLQQRIAEQEDQDRADIDGQEFEAALGWRSRPNRRRSRTCSRSRG
jgi:hypothetical protein